MQVIEKINFLLEEKNISKKEFVAKLQSLSPKLYATGEVPSEQTIYRYLNGENNILEKHEVTNKECVDVLKNYEGEIY